MRPITALLMVAALGCSFGCREKEAAEKPGKPVETDLLVRYHFVGTASLAGNPNATKLKELWTLPQTGRLVEQTLQKLAHAPRTLYGERISPAQDERGALLLRPLLDDLLQSESFLQMRAPAGAATEWTLLVQLSAERLKVWRAGLKELLQLWKLGTTTTNTIEGFPAWEVKRTDPPTLVRFVEAGSWLALGLGPNNLAGVGEAARRIKAGGRPIAAAICRD